jgi:signal transduction histidine kinase
MAVFRWGAWVWMAVVMLLNRDDLDEPLLAWSLLGIALAWTVAATILVERNPAFLERPEAVVIELAIALMLGIGGGIVYAKAHTAGEAFSSVRTIGFAWPLVGIMSAGVLYGGVAGLGSGVLVAIPRWFAPVVDGVGFNRFESGHWFSLASTTLLYGLAGGVAGYMATLLRRAESEVAAARAREDVARTLHDGVLQTLAIIERRSGDEDLARMAREQERDLREFLFGAGPSADRGGAKDVGPRLRAAATRFEDAFGGRVDVVLAPDLPHLDPARADALAGAVGEALVNAGKHGRATRVTVYAEPADDGGIACSVHDDGTGFDVKHAREGVGLSRSIRGRMHDVGGNVEIESRPGAGTEVRLWLP